ncbi:MAG: RtcB family protein [Nanoarchaeota archaeon]|nr:RtcB family protein [Nanoarchaeota archaeon]
MKPRKLNSYSYIVEKEGAMRVPLKIFASEKIMNQLETDRCIQQGINVAALPGIKGWSIMMPDAHQGYGFSIGGVAAIDKKDGCISPGGIGFDINCLPEGTRVLTEHGFHKPIEQFELDFDEVDEVHPAYTLKLQRSLGKLVSFDLEKKGLIAAAPAFFMKKEHTSQIVAIQTSLGYSIRATPEHPILTQQGMKPAGELKKGDSIAVHPFEGVPYTQPDGRLLVSESSFAGQQKDALNKRGLLPLHLSHSQLPIIARLFGYLLGDGSIYFSGNKGFVNAYGSKEALLPIQNDLKELGFKSAIYGRMRNHAIPTRYGLVEFTSETHELHCSSRSLANLFYVLGYPQGDKTVATFKLPDWLCSAPLWIKRLFLSGFFGAELSKPRTHTKTGFDCPTISINKNAQAIAFGRAFAIQIMLMLEEFGVETSALQERDDFHNRHGKTKRLKIQISSREENLARLWSMIGYAYNPKRSMLADIALLYIREKKRMTLHREEVARKVKSYKEKGLSLREVQELLASPSTNARFIERHYYGKAGQRINLDFDSFETYVGKKEAEHLEHGCFFDTIEDAILQHFSGTVYDFTVPKTHSFIADNIIVSNCGVRLLVSNLTRENVLPKIKPLLDRLFAHIPPGVGAKATLRLTMEEMEELLTEGAPWMVKRGYGVEADVENCEEHGRMEEADPTFVSKEAKQRGKAQIGTLGAGNHFLEVQYVGKIFDKAIAKAFGIEKEGQVVILIHCGSRGLGHQTCTDYLRKMEDAFPEIVATLPEKDLIYAPSDSHLAHEYYKAMCAAANFAWANRHMIGHQARIAFKEIFGDAVELHTVYDVCHNIAKVEDHEADGEKFTAWVHRKGATRAFGPGRKELPKKYQKTGQPIFIPGSMGTSSYVLVGTEKAMKESFGSTAHGAGRVMSRKQASNTWRGEDIQADLEKQQIYIKAASWKGITEEAPLAYKDVDEVVRVSHDAGIGKMVAQLKPIGVVKG